MALLRGPRESAARPCQECPGAGRELVAPAAPARDADPPSHIGLYRLEKLLGEGGFATVYLAEDDQLQCSMAIKWPNAPFVHRARHSRKGIVV